MTISRHITQAATSLLNRTAARRRARRQPVITQPTGSLDPTSGRMTFVMVVGPTFNQDKPNATMVIRMGYCHAFEQLGIPYLIANIDQLQLALESVPNPVCFVMGHDLAMQMPGKAQLDALKRVPHCYWVDPWFAGSKAFYRHHSLDRATWAWPRRVRRAILETQPRFVHTPTVERGMQFFEQWSHRGLNVKSLPLACDTTLYSTQAPLRREFENIDLAFVGGYWKSKARQIDPYLKPFESQLRIYGYNAWPYRGYQGQLPRDAEPSLYRQARLCPTINEPSVAVLHGSINERIFKIMGCGGCTVVDAVPGYRDLFSKDELPIPESANDFGDMVRTLLHDDDARHQYAARGHNAVMQRHTYIHRAQAMLDLFDMTIDKAAGDQPATDKGANPARRLCA